MSKKKADQQNSRDECVRKIADELRKDKWEVKADAEGFETPSRIAGAVPAVEAKKGCFKRICEVATEEMFEGDKDRYIELKNYCDEYDFHFYLVDKEGNRREIDPATFGKKDSITKHRSDI
jgi:hypothetical protein